MEEKGELLWLKMGDIVELVFSKRSVHSYYLLLDRYLPSFGLLGKLILL